MEKIFFIIVVLLHSTIAFAQLISKQIIIADSIDKEIIEFAYIVDNFGVVCAISGKTGRVHIELDKQHINKELFVLRSAYKECAFKISTVNDTLFLSPKVEKIKEVKVTANKEGTVYYTYYFKSYDTQNKTVRRYIDGIVEYAVNKRKRDIKRKVLQYRSFINKEMFKGDKVKFIEINYEATGILNYKLLSTLDIVRLYDDYTLSDSSKKLLIIKDKNSGEEIGKIFTDSLGREKSAYFLDINQSGRTKKFLGSEGRIVFELEEEHFTNTNEGYYINKRRFIQKALFRKKRKKEDFDEYMVFSELLFLDTHHSSDNKAVKFRRDNSNYHEKFWENKKYTKVSKALIPLDKLTETENKN